MSLLSASLAVLRPGVIASLLLTTGVFAASQNSTSADNGQSSATTRTRGETQVRVMRATDLIGTDVMSSDDRKVGDIVDYVFDLAQPPRLDYVLVMTGGFLDLGGEVRAVPASALTLNGDTAHIQLTKEQYLAMPKTTGGATNFLSDPQNVAQIDRAFSVSPAASNGSNSQSTTANNNLVTFSAMNQRDAYSAQNGRLGYIDDVWMSLNRDRAPFVEITPMFRPFEATLTERYALPIARLQPGYQDNRYTFNVSIDDLNKANSASDSSDVQVVQSGFIGDQVLRVTVPAAGRKHAKAGAPTGHSSHAAKADAQASTAAQAIRQALDNDTALRSAQVQVVPEQNKVVLRGSVNDSDIRGKIEHAAENAAHDVSIDNEITVANK